MSVKAGPIEYDAATALLVVDVQNDFADPAGSLSVSGALEILPLINEEVRRATEAGALVVYTQDWHPEHTPHFAADGGTWPVHCVHDSWGAELHPDLIVAGAIVRKGIHGEDGYSGFTMREPLGGDTVPTPLDGLLRERGIGRVVVCGLATDYCVNATAVDAAALGYETLVLADAVRAVDLRPRDGEAAMARMRAAGVRVVGAGTPH